MKGTEKQIKWAEDIIRGARETLDRNIELIDKNGTAVLLKDRRQCLVDCKESLEKMLAGIDDAAKIINMRERLSSRAILQMVENECFRRNNHKWRKR